MKIHYPDAEIRTEIVEVGRLSRKLRARGGGLMMVEVFFEKGAEGSAHRHPHEQVTYCLDGAFQFDVDGEKITLRAGDSLYVPSNAMHGTVCLEKGRLLDAFTPQREDFLPKD